MAAPAYVLLLAGSLHAAPFGRTVHLGCWNALLRRMDLPFAENQPQGEREAEVELPRCLGAGS